MGLLPLLTPDAHKNLHDRTDGFTNGCNNMLHRPHRSLTSSSGSVTSHLTVVVIATQSKAKRVDTNKQDSVHSTQSTHARWTIGNHPGHFLSQLLIPQFGCIQVVHFTVLSNIGRMKKLPAHSPRPALEVSRVVPVLTVTFLAAQVDQCILQVITSARPSSSHSGNQTTRSARRMHCGVVVHVPFIDTLLR